MRLPPGYRVGSATHTGSVRAHNEDDFLLGAVGEGEAALLLGAVADGIGGAAGGAEASRAALRALGACVLDPGGGAPDERLAAGFRAAAARLHEQATLVPFLREMGTTMTVLALCGGRAFVGHVGDTRLYRWRRGRLEQCTEDHAAREPDNVLLRWLGGGRSDADADWKELGTQPGDRWILVSDGVWSVVPPVAFAAIAAKGSPQAAAEALVLGALDGGGPDNATAVVIDVVAGEAEASVVDLPAEERPRSRDRWPPPPSLRAPRWPWLLLCLALLAGAELALRELWGIDLLAMLGAALAAV